MKYQLNMNVPDKGTPEQIATMLEQSADQVRGMSSIRAAHSMVISKENAYVDDAEVKHGTGEPGVWIAVVETSEGNDVGLYDSEDTAYAGVARLIRDFGWWKEAVDEASGDDEPFPAEPPEDDRECVRLYFEVMNEASSGEWLFTDCMKVRTKEDVANGS